MTPGPDDLSVMLFTSGTTGRPKGVPRTHRAEHAAAVAHLVQTGQRSGEVALGVMPLFHTMGLRTLLATVLAGGTWVPQARFDAAEAAELIVRERISSLYLVPTMYWSLLRDADPAGLAGVRRLAYAGAAMAPVLAQQLTEAVAPETFVNHFGSTEIYTFTIGPDVAAKPGCAGRPGMFSRVRLVDPSPGASPDAEVAAGEPGQVAVSMASPEAFAGYWMRPDATERAVRDGWYFTGDLAVADDDGDLWVSGRVDDMINTGGENVYPDEIEAALVCCPAVADVVVVGLPDERWGQAVTAFVVPPPTSPPARPSPRRTPGPAGSCPRCDAPSAWSPSTPCPAPRSARRCAACSSTGTSSPSRTPPEPRDDLDARPRRGRRPGQRRRPFRRRPRPAARDPGGGDRAQPAPARPHPGRRPRAGPARTPASPR